MNTATQHQNHQNHQFKSEMAPHCGHEVEDTIDDLIREDPEVDTKISMSNFERLR